MKAKLVGGELLMRIRSSNGGGCCCGDSCGDLVTRVHPSKGWQAMCSTAYASDPSISPSAAAPVPYAPHWARLSLLPPPLAKQNCLEACRPAEAGDAALLCAGNHPP